MGLLEDLKKQAQALKEEQLAEEEKRKKEQGQLRAQLAPALGSIYEYLNELVEQVNIIKPEIALNFSIEGLGELTGLMQGDYHVSRRGDDQIESVSLMFTLVSDKEYRFEAQKPGAIDAWLSDLRGYGLRLHNAQLVQDSAAGQRVKVVLDGYVPVHFRFQANYDAMAIGLTIRNFDQLGDKRHLLRPNQIDDAFLDELAKYVLRRENKFLKEEVPEAYRRKLRQRIDEEQKKKHEEVSGTFETLSSRVKYLFKRRPTLHLRFGKQLVEVDEKGPTLAVGRGAQCDLVIDEKHVSRNHARFEYRDGEFFIIDQSRNGTFINPKDGKGTYVHKGEMALCGRGTISLGQPIERDHEHLIHYSC